MTIDLKEQTNDAAYLRDVTNVGFQFNRLRKKPDMKIKNYIHIVNWCLVATGILDLVFAVMATDEVGRGFCIGLVAVYSAFFCMSVIGKKNLKNYAKRLQEPVNFRELTIDENGIDMNVENTIRYHIDYEDIEAVRIHNNFLFFITRQKSILMGTNIKYKDEIMSAMNLYHPGTLVLA